MTTQKNPQFPVGTVIVKEKYFSPDSKSPELMTVMAKHAQGYNPGCNDWEFLVFDGTGTGCKRTAPCSDARVATFRNRHV